MRRNKYHVAPRAERTATDGTVFDSKAEMKRYNDLRIWQMTREIRDLRRQVEYPLVINGIKVGVFTADFVYEKQTSASACDGFAQLQYEEIIEDVKGVMTTDASLRIKIFEALYGKKVHIVKM